MGEFLFRWAHPASDVHVTGTFDDWSKSVQLEKKAGHFEKLVKLPREEKIYYKFVVDDNWTTDHTAPQEIDKDGNVNNVLHSEQVIKSGQQLQPSAFISGVSPASTTAQMAGSVPKGSAHEGRPDSAEYPETPFHDAQEFDTGSVPEAPGTTSNSGNLATRSTKDSQQDFGVAPLPATSGIGNPVSLQPGEKVPPTSDFTSNTINSHVTTDKASYEDSGSSRPQDAGATRDVEGAMFNLPPVSGNMIPESSLPMGKGAGFEADKGPMFQSAGAGSTTAGLAGNVPMEPRGVPQVVSASQREAGVGPEASANQEAVKEKSAMEKELESKVPEETTASEGTMTGGTSRGLPSSIQQSIDAMNRGTAISPEVPDTVQKSIAEAHYSPEAAASSQMVDEKSAVESQLLETTKKENMGGEPAPSTSAGLIDTAPATAGSGNKEASSITTAAAPALTPAAANSMQAAVQDPPADSRDISPMSHPVGNGQSQPAVTTGVGASSAPSKSTPSPAVPAKASPAANSSAGMDKKSKRSSGFFGKLKSKFGDKDKK